MSGAVAVFGSSQTLPGSPEWIDAEKVGSSLAGAGLAVITGGYGGTMEAVSKGASEVGGHVIGVTAPSLFPDRTGPNRYVGELIEAQDLLHRIGVMMARAHGTITLPGSIGTVTEMLIAWNLNYLNRLRGSLLLPGVAVGERLRLVVSSIAEGDDEATPHVVDSGAEAVTWLLPRLVDP